MYGLFPLMMDIDELSVNGTLCIDVMYLSGKMRFADIFTEYFQFEIIGNR